MTCPPPRRWPACTDRAIALEALALAGVPHPRTQVDAFQRLLAQLAPGVTDLVREQGRVLPGAAEAIRALAAGPWDGGPLVQSVLTGNMRVMAQVKLGALGLDRDLDLRVGAYGDAHEIRADLVPLARASATAAYGADFSGAATVLVGDTPLDVEAAQMAGARAVAVASGEFSVADLTASGADAVLPDLTDTAAVLAAILPALTVPGRAVPGPGCHERVTPGRAGGDPPDRAALTRGGRAGS